jgi:hypothetical protein
LQALALLLSSQLKFQKSSHCEDNLVKATGASAKKGTNTSKKMTSYY